LEPLSQEGTIYILNYQQHEFIPYGKETQERSSLRGRDPEGKWVIDIG
jgi:hypothetical protein